MHWCSAGFQIPRRTCYDLSEPGLLASSLSPWSSWSSAGPSSVGMFGPPPSSQKTGDLLNLENFVLDLRLVGMVGFARYALRGGDAARVDLSPSRRRWLSTAANKRLLMRADRAANAADHALASVRKGLRKHRGTGSDLPRLRWRMLGRVVAPSRERVDDGWLVVCNQGGRASCRERVCQYV